LFNFINASTLLTLAEGAVLLNGVKALVAKVGGTEALKIIANL
jgi:hypothetical protein